MAWFNKKKSTVDKLEKQFGLSKIADDFWSRHDEGPNGPVPKKNQPKKKEKKKDGK